MPQDLDRGEQKPRPQPPPDRCELCGAPATLGRHCKIVCRNCGFVRDCSDP